MLLSEALPCMRSITPSAEEKETTIKVLNNYFDGYAFRDIYLNQSSQANSYGGESIDIFTRLDEIGNTYYESTFDFYGNITKLVNSLHCSHTSFTMPCMTPFEYLLPIYFYFEQSSSGGQNRAYAQPLIDEYADYVLESIIGAEVLYVNLDGGQVDPKVSPTVEEAIKIWADEEEQISRNPYARWQKANSGSFYSRQASLYPLPKSESIKIRVRINEVEQDVDVPILVYAYEDVTDLEKFCNVNEAFGTKSKTHYNSKSNTSNISINKTPKNITAPINKKELAKRLKDLMKMNEKETLIKERDRIDLLWRERQKKIVEITKDSRKLTSFSNRTVDLDYGLDRIQKKRVETLKKLSHKAKFNHSYTLPDKFKRKDSKKDNEIESKIVTGTSDGSLFAIHMPQYELGIIAITTFTPEDIDEFQSVFFDIVNQLSDNRNQFYSKKLLIDLRYNGGGYKSLPPIITRFLFPHANSPLWEPMDYVKSRVNSINGKIKDFVVSESLIADSDIQLDEQTGEVIYDYYSQNGPQRRTQSDSGLGLKDIITVDLTKRATYYSGRNLHQFMSRFCEDCTLEESCKVSNFGGVQNGARYNAGTAGGSSTLNNGYFEEKLQQYFDDPSEFESVGITEKDFPGIFYRQGTSLSFVDSEFYGVTQQTKDKLSEFYIYDADFHINYVENYGDQIRWTIKDYTEMYARVITEVDFALNGDKQPSKVKKNADQLGCFFGEVEIKGWLSQTECLEKVKSDPDSIYGYRCEASKNRNPDGKRSIGQFVRNVDGCIFSHCRPGYNRIGKNCVKELILHEE
ncbi:MAG: hypothetical protein EZS28_012848, partial [Streblomastix strix]